MVFEVGDETSVYFWKDKWCGLMTLCDAFPNLFVITAHKNVEL